MLTYNWKGHILLTLALFPVRSGAVDFSQCLADVITCANNTGECTLNMSNTTAFSILRTSQGHSVTFPGDATALSYPGCTQYCGTGLEQFSWTSFAQDYAAWLLPYLALVSQLPFGAQRRTDNLMSAVLTLGSPTLAGYSLYMTLLNSRSVNDQLFAGIDYPSPAIRRSVVRALSNLQQVPLRIHPDGSGRFESLVVHPDNDGWWTTLAEELDYSHRWSIASAASITWVVIAYLLTVADSIANVPNNIDSNGEGTGTGWLWLLPIVVGWLVLSPKCDWKRVYDAYNKANRHVVVADSWDRDAAPTHVDSNFGLTINPSPDWLCATDITSPDETRMPPIFNYARAYMWYRNVYLTSLFYRAAWRKSNARIGVHGEPISGVGHSGVPRTHRAGTCDEIICYCRPDDYEHIAANVLWPRGLLYNMIVASLMSLQLQWGTTGAAFLVVWFIPTMGIGCRSLVYLLYGTLSTAVWMLLVLSSTLGYYAHHLLHDSPPLDWERDQGHMTLGVPSLFSSCKPSLKDDGDQHDSDSDASTSFTAIKHHLHSRQIYGQAILVVADWLRWIGKFIAIINAIGIVANSIFQYAGVYTNCFCDSSVYTWGGFAFNVIQPNQGDVDLARKAWIGGLALALSCCSFFVGSIYLIRDALPQ